MKIGQNWKTEQGCTSTCLTCTCTSWPKMTRTEIVPVQAQIVPVQFTRKCPEWVFSPIFPYVSTPINSILHIHLKTISNSFCNIFSIQFLFQYLSLLQKSIMNYSQITLIWVMTHTQPKYKDFVRVCSNPTLLPCNKSMNPTLKGGFHVFFYIWGFTHLTPIIILG